MDYKSYNYQLFCGSQTSCRTAAKPCIWGNLSTNSDASQKKIQILGKEKSILLFFDV